MAPSQSSRSISSSNSNSANKFFIASVEQFPFTTSTSTSVVGLQRSCGASSKMHRSPSFLLIAGVVLVTLFMNVSGYSASSVDEHSSKSDSNLSKEELQLSATSGLVKRSAPSHSSSYGHSIMRFGRAPHNIMHFGKRGGSVAGSNNDLDQSTDALASDSSTEIGGLGLGAATNSIPEWIINNYLQQLGGLKQQSQPQHDSGRTMTKYMLVPITVRDPSSSSNFGPSSLTSSSLSANYPNYKGLSGSSIKRAKLSEENDNVFMHFG